MKSIRVAIVDDQQLFRQGIGMLINNMPNTSLLFEADNGSDCLDKLKFVKELPHIILTDMEMPVMDGIELTNKLHEKYADIKIIILSVHAQERLIARMIQLGANGYLLKNCDKEELITAINTTYQNGFYLNANALKAIQSLSTKKPTIKNVNGITIDISPREKEVLEMICKELTNAEIAEKLFISIRTVDGHRNNLLSKTGCKNTAGLVLFAVKNHLYNLLF